MEKNINKKAFPVRSMSEVQFKLWDCKSDCEKLKEKSSNLTVKRKDMQVKLDFGNYHNPIADIFPTLDNNYFLNKNNIVETINPVCKHCHSHKVIKCDVQSRKIVSNTFNDDLTIQRYKCKKCGKTFQLNLNEIIDENAIFTNEEKNKALAVKELNSSSLRDISKYYEIFNRYTISYETIRKNLIVIEGNEINYNVIKMSGYYGYDAQWVKINKKWKYRHTIFDIVQKIPIAEYFADEDNNEVVYDFINRTIDHKDRIAIITDMKKGYDNVMRKLKFKRHQYCLFHFKQTINDIINKHINKLRQKESSKIKKSHKNPSKDFIKQEVDKIVKAENEEIEEALEILYSIFECKTFKEANNQIQIVKQKSKDFPKFLKEYLDKNFFPIYKNFIYYLEKPYSNHLERTNNRLEGYFRTTLPKKNKKNYRSFKGLINEVYHKGIGWIKNKEKKEKKKLIKDNK